MSLDLADKRILLELDANCRTSYQRLSTKLGLSVSAIKKRMEKLIHQGVIRRFIVYLSLAMAGADALLAILSTDRGQADDAFLEGFGANPMVWAVVPLFNDDILVFAEYVGAQGLAKLGEFLRGVEGVTKVEMHTLLYDRGSKRELTDSDLQVLQCVRRNPRIPVVEIAQQTHLAPRRAKQSLQKLLGEGGSTPEYFAARNDFADTRTSQACVHFRIHWNLNAVGRTTFFIRIDWNEDATSRGDLVKWLEEQFPIEFWYALASASAPVLFGVFAVEQIRDAEVIAQKIRQSRLVKLIEPLFTYPTKWFLSPREALLDEMLAKAGLSPLGV